MQNEKAGNPRFWTHGAARFLACLRWIERGEAGLAAVAAVQLARIMREN